MKPQDKKIEPVVDEKKETKAVSADAEIGRVAKALEEALAAWRVTHLDWFVYDSFYKGNHYLALNTQDFTIRNNPKGATIPFIYHVIRLIANEVSKITPKWEFAPNQDNPKAVDDAINMGFLMDKVFEDANISQLLRDGGKEALKFSACPFFIGWDDKINKCIISLENPFYILPDPRARNLQEAKYVVRIVESDLLTVKNNQDYDQDQVGKLKPEVKVGGTPIYERVMTETNKIYPNQENPTTDNFSIFIKEFYEKVEENGVTRIKLTVVSQDALLFQDITDLEDYPFEFLYADKDPLTFYGEGWAKSLISINKMINKLETQKAIYLDKVAEPRYLLTRGSTIDRKVVNGVPVTFYDANLRDRPEPEIVPPWPNSADASLQHYTDYMRDFGGMSDILLGNVPAGVEANKAIESLIEQSGNITVEVKKNLIDFLKRLAKKTLWNYSNYLSEVQTISTNETEPMTNVNPETMEIEEMQDPNGEPMVAPKRLNIIGANTQRAKDLGADARDILFLTSDMDIKVETTSEIASTAQGRWDKIMEMIDRQILPVETALDLLKVGPVKDIMKKFEEQQAKEMDQKAQEAEMNKAEPEPVDTEPKISIGFKDLPVESQIVYLQSQGLYPTDEQRQAQLMEQLQAMQMAAMPQPELAAPPVAEEPVPSELEQQIIQQLQQNG